MITLIYFSILFNINVQKDTHSEVYDILKAKDSLLFERAFNKCETQFLDQLIADDFEFYHDKSGIQESKEAFIKVMQNGICNPNNTTKSRRELVKGSLDVFPLKNNGQLYGALQNGTHKFFETTNGKEIAGSTAQFSHLWILENEHWVLKRVISFDHQMQETSITEGIEVSDVILDSYLGQYQAEDSGLVIISRTEKGLHINAEGMEADIYAKSQTLFALEKAPLTFEFIIDTNNNTQKFIVREHNKIVEEAIKQ